MESGSLRHRVELYTVTTTADGQGGSTAVYTLESTRFAEVKQLSMGESMRSGLVAAELNYRITLRRPTGTDFNRSITQIRWNGKRLSVTSVVTDEFWYNINATERQ